MKRPKSHPGLAPIALSTLTALVWSPLLLALDPSLDLRQYTHTARLFREGFLNGTVSAFAQTPDGYLWLGTQSGAVRFDGVRAAPLALLPGQQLPSTAVSALLAGRDGTLWIGTLDGLASWKNGRLTHYPALAQYSVNALLQDRDGTVWAGAFGGPTGKLCAIRGENTTCYGDDGKLGAGVASLYEDRDGSLWVGAVNGLWRWRPGPPTRYLATPIPSRQVAFAQGDHPSSVLVAINSVRQIVGQEVMNYPLHGVPSPLTASSLFRDRNGGLWIGTTAHGLVRSYQGKISLFTHNDGLSSDRVVALFEDREGTIWVATADGLDRFRESPVRSLSVSDGLSSATATSVLAARDGSVWIGTVDGLNRWNDGQMKIYRTRSDPGLPDDAIDSLFEDERGRIWVSGFRGLAVFENGKFIAVPAVPAGSKHAIAGDNHGGLWLSLGLTSKGYGLVHLVEGRIIEQVPWQTVGGGPGSGLVPDPDGGVWTGLISGGIAHFSGGQIRKLPLRNDAPGAPRVEELSRDRDGTMWAATEDGLSRIAQGHVATLTAANGLPCNSVHWIIEDGLSSYWLCTRCGLLRIARTELDAWIADPQRTIKPTTFDSADGIRLVAIAKGTRPRATKSSDGKIWFVNGDTVSVIDPSNIGTNTLPPPVHIERITADGKTYDATRGLRLPSRVRNIVVDYTALSLVAPERVHFRYLLEGQDPDWREVVNDRKVQYSNLAPGNYRFRVIASNNSGVWNDKGDVLDFSIAPAYYQTNWFRALGAVVIAALLWGAYQFRLRQLQRAFNMRLEERVNERTRIARELHDTILQTFQGLMLRFQVGVDRLPTGETKEALEKALERGDEAIAEGREAIHDLRSSTEITNDLAQAVTAIGDEMASEDSGPNSPKFSVVVEGPSRDLHPILRDEIYRIAREAVRNAFRHAQARQIEAEITYSESLLRVRIRDDGRGLDPEIVKEGRGSHYGLPGMRERATRIEGQLSVWTGIGAGTEIELIIPGSIAYGTSPGRTILGLFRKKSANR